LDLDLFTTERGRLDELGSRLEQWCVAEGVGIEVQRSYPGFRRYRVWTDEEVTLVDLVHELAPQVVPVADKPFALGIRVDPVRELRANKLAALLGRAETKDLLDLYFLERRGTDALAGLGDACLKDGGMEPATLAWVLAGLRVDLEGLLLDERIEVEELEGFRDRLIEQLQRLCWPSRAD